MIVGNKPAPREFRWRALGAGIIATLGMALLVGRLYQLQILKGEEYRARSVGNFNMETRLPSDRGMILDTKGRVLVDSRASFNVTLTPAVCQAPDAPKGTCYDKVIPLAAELLDLTSEETTRIKEQFRRVKGLVRYRDFTIKVDADQDTLDRITANKLDLPGIEVVMAPHRNYRYGKLAAHTLGYMNEISSDELELPRYQEAGYQLGDYIGRRGIERKLERDLHGVDGRRKMVVDAKGRRIETAEHLLPEQDRYVAPIPGNNVVLSLDLDLQRAAERLFNVPAGALVVVDVKTGFILAMVSKPAYDPNLLTGRISRAQFRELADNPLLPMIFRGIQQHYHPGSTFKIVTALAALEAKTATASTKVGCNGGYTLGGRRWRCHIDRGHGLVDLHKALAASCDTWFYAEADRMGIEPISIMAEKFGFGRPSDLGLSPETPGIIPSIEYHDRVTRGGYTKGLALNAAIGQGDVNVTPVQLAMAFAAVANGGTVYRPQIVRKIVGPDGDTIEEAAPEVVSRLDVDPKNLELIREGLLAVVNEPGGTAYKSRIPEATVAGKTGTAQVIGMAEGTRVKSENLTYFRRDHAWFAAYAPANDPEIAIVSLNEHGGHGGSAAAPFAMELFRTYFRLHYPERSAELTAAQAAKGTKSAAAPGRAKDHDASVAAGGTQATGAQP